MATQTLQTSIEISGILSPSLQQSIARAVSELNRMSQETIEAASASQKLAAQIKTEESVLKTLEQGYADYVLEGREGTEEAQRLAREIQSLNGDINQNRDRLQQACTAADQLSREYNDTENEAGELDRSLEHLDDTAAQTNEGFTVFKATLANLASQAITAAASAVKGFVSDVVSLGREFQATMSEVGALSGASAEDLERLEATARQFGSTTVFSATEAGEALKYMSLAGWDTDQSISALGGVLDLAAASGMGLGQASDMVTDYLSAFSMEAEQSAYFADMLAYAQANSNTSAQQLGEAYKNCAANLNAAGQDVETVTSLLQGMADQGYKGSEAGTALSAMMRDLTKNMDEGKIMIGDTAVTVMDAAGNYRDLTDILRDVSSAVDGMGGAERAMALSTTFTADSTKGLNLLLNKGIENISDYEDALRVCDGAAKDMAATMNDNLEGDLKNLGSAFDELKLKVYDKLEPVMRQGVQFLTNDVIPAVTNIKQYIPEISIALASLSAVVAAFKWQTILANLTKIQGAFKGIMAAIGGVSAPAIAVIAALTAVAFAVKQLWETNDSFRYTVINTWAKIKQSFIQFGDGITLRLNKLGFSFTDITDVLKSAWQGFVDFVKPVVLGAFKLIESVIGTTLETILGVTDVFIALFSGDWSGAWENTKKVFETVWNGVKEAFALDTETLKKTADVFLGWFGTSWDEVWSKVPQPVKNAMDSAKGFISTKMDEAKTYVSGTVIPGIQDAWKTYSPVVKEIFKESAEDAITKYGEVRDFVSESVVPAITEKWEMISEKVSSVIDFVKPYVMTAFEDIREFVTGTVVPVLTEAWENIKNSIGPVIEFIKTDVIPQVQEFVGSIVSAVQSAWELIKVVFDKMKPYLTVVFGAIVAVAVTAWQVIKAAFEPAVRVIGGAFKLAWEVIKNVWNAASKYFKMVVDNISSLFSGVKSLIEGDFSGAWEAVKNIFSNWNEFFGSLMTSLKNILKAGFSFVGTYLKELWTFLTNLFEPASTWITDKVLMPISNAFSKVWTSISTTVKKVWNTIKNVIKVGIKFIAELMKAAFKIITIPFRFIWENCKDIVIKAWNKIKDVISKTVTKIHDFISDKFNKVKNVISVTITAIKTVLENTWNKISSKVSEIWNKIHDTVSTKINAVKTVVTDVINKVKDTMSQIWDKISSKVSEIWNNIYSKVSEKVNAVKDVVSEKFQNVFNTIKDKCESAFSKVSEIFGNIKSKIDDKVTGAKNTVTDMFQGIFGAIKDKSENAFSKVSEIFGNIYNKITDKITAAKDKVSEMIDKIKEKFNFSWSLPHLKLPHFSFNGEFKLNPPSVPTFNVDWYANGGIMTKPTLFGMNGSRAMVGGEAGAEAILPLDTLWTKLAALFEMYKEDSAVSVGESSLTRKASQLFRLDNFSLGELASGGGTTIIYDFSNFTWSPEVNMNGGDSDSFMDQLRTHEYEFFDWLSEFVKVREASYYA